jgi:hypothetical protein
VNRNVVTFTFMLPPLLGLPNRTNRTNVHMMASSALLGRPKFPNLKCIECPNCARNVPIAALSGGASSKLVWPLATSMQQKPSRGSKLRDADVVANKLVQLHRAIPLTPDARLQQSKRFVSALAGAFARLTFLSINQNQK